MLVNVKKFKGYLRWLQIMYVLLCVWAINDIIVFNYIGSPNVTINISKDFNGGSVSEEQMKKFFPHWFTISAHLLATGVLWSYAWQETSHIYANQITNTSNTESNKSHTSSKQSIILRIFNLRNSTSLTAFLTTVKKHPLRVFFGTMCIGLQHNVCEYE